MSKHIYSYITCVYRSIHMLFLQTIWPSLDIKNIYEIKPQFTALCPFNISINSIDLSGVRLSGN